MKKKYFHISSECNWKKDNQGLYLLIHGVKGHPSIWDNQLSLLKKEHKEAEIRAYHVFKKGNCSLKEASQPLKKIVENYIKENPNKPICLIGVSNGARIAADIESSLRGQARFKVSCIAGPFLGSKFMNLGDKLYIARFLFNKEFVEELKFESDISKKLLKRMQGSPKGTYEFYATKDDTQIFPYTSSLPSLYDENSFHVVCGCFHNGIVKKVRNDQIKSCAAWMKENSNYYLKYK